MQELKEFIEEQKKEGCKFAFHNGIGYDGPTLNRLVGTSLTVNDIIDTMVMSMVYNPSLEGGHSLKSWGIRMKDGKISFDDFSQFSEEQLEYCEQDTRLCGRVYVALRKKMLSLGFTDQGLNIEHRAWALKERQKTNGFFFNIDEAEQLYATLRNLENDIRDEIYTHWPPRLDVVKECVRPFKKNGEASANYSRHLEQYPLVEVIGDRYQCYDYICFDIGSPVQRVEKLIELGWVNRPSEVTKTGKPRPTKKGQLVPSLAEFSKENPQVKLIVDWMNANYLANMVNTWIEAYNPETKCIHGSLFLANSLRYKHSAPNTANIPAVRIHEEVTNGTKVKRVLRGIEGGFTYEARALWGCRDPENRSLVGVDAAGIQLRILAHYLNNKDFTEAILSDDPHSMNQQKMGLSSRALTKTITYATLMGAGDTRIAEEARVSLEEAKDAKRKFFEQVPELPALIKRLTTELSRTGRITLCSGNKIIVPQAYTVIPYLLQGDESQIMKQAAIFAAAEVRRRKLDVLKVGDIHDEWQSDVLNAHVEEFALSVCPLSFKLAGEAFNYNLPIECSHNIGFNWAQTH